MNLIFTKMILQVFRKIKFLEVDQIKFPCFVSLLELHFSFCGVHFIHRLLECNYLYLFKILTDFCNKVFCFLAFWSFLGAFPQSVNHGWLLLSALFLSYLLSSTANIRSHKINHKVTKINLVSPIRCYSTVLSYYGYKLIIC